MAITSQVGFLVVNPSAGHHAPGFSVPGNGTAWEDSEILHSWAYTVSTWRDPQSHFYPAHIIVGQIFLDNAYTDLCYININISIHRMHTLTQEYEVSQPSTSRME